MPPKRIGANSLRTLAIAAAFVIRWRTAAAADTRRVLLCSLRDLLPGHASPTAAVALAVVRQRPAHLRLPRSFRRRRVAVVDMHLEPEVRAYAAAQRREASTESLAARRRAVMEAEDTLRDAQAAL